MDDDRMPDPLPPFDALPPVALSPRDSLQPPQPPSAPDDALQPPEPPPPAPLPPFALERFFSRWEFAARHLLCCSDAEPLSMADLLGMADADAAARWADLRLSYTETQGLPALREAIAASLYTSITPDQVVISAPQEAVLLCMQSLLRPGDHVVCTFPGYQSLYEVARSFGCRVDLWELSRCAGSHSFIRSFIRGLAWHGLLLWAAHMLLPINAEQTCHAPMRRCHSGADGAPATFRREDAERLIVPGTTRLVVVNSPHNPSGAHLSQDDWRYLCGLCEGSGAYLFRSAAASACAASAWCCCVVLLASNLLSPCQLP